MSSLPTPSEVSAPIGEGIISHRQGLTIERELGFNAWRSLLLRLLDTTDRALWSLADARAYGDRYAREYHQALVELDERSSLLQRTARVARAIPYEQRRGQLSFELHAQTAALEADERERWLDEAERQGWSWRQLRMELGAAADRRAPVALAIRATGELYSLCQRAAERRGMAPRAWALETLERAARAELAREAA